MFGGLLNTTRKIFTEGPYGAFEQACEAALGEAVRQDDDVAVKLWCALSNIQWHHAEHGEVGYTFRAAGDLVAALRGSGHYMDWYCSGNEGVVDELVGAALGKHGWTWSEYE